MVCSRRLSNFFFFSFFFCFFFFVFQAEDGIRDRDVNGVQTCALPISQHMGAVFEISNEQCTNIVVFFRIAAHLPLIYDAFPKMFSPKSVL